MNTATAYARRARAARDAAQDLLYPTPEPIQPYTRHDDQRAARLADYAIRCADLASKAAGPEVTRPERLAMDHAADARTAWTIIRHDRQRRAGLRALRRTGTILPEAQQVPMHQQ